MTTKNMYPQSSAPRVTLEPLGRPVSASFAVPGSKSLANRAILLAAVSRGISRISGIPDSDDIAAALGAVAALGVPVFRRENVVAIEGRGLDFAKCFATVDIRSSGTVGRFLPGLLAAAPDGDWILTATEQLSGRPIAPLLDALHGLGADLESIEPGRSFPLRVRGQGLLGGDVDVSAARSSQFASGVIMAAPLASRPVRILVRDLDPEEAYINLTLDLLRRFGVGVNSSPAVGGLLVEVDAPQAYRSAELTIEADFNSALYFLALPLLVGGSVAIENLGNASGQPGLKFLDVLTRLGGCVVAGSSRIEVSASGLPLRGGFVVDMRAMSEMALTLGVLAVFADAPVTMTNLAHIRGHETDRLAVLADTLERVGARSESGDDWIRVHPAERSALKAAEVDSHDDHRLVMSFALLGLAANGIAIANPGAVDKTFPEFFQFLSRLGAGVSYS